MQQSLAILTAVWLALPSSAQASAWLREQGAGFTSLSFGVTQSSETTNGLYFEYGLTGSTTIGLDISAFTNSLGQRNGFGNLFLRRNLGRTDGQHRFAYEIGVGGLWGNDRQLPTLKTGLSWGYGFQQAGGNGWMSLDLAYIYEPEMGQDIAKVDATLGLAFSSFTTGLLEFTLSEQNDDTYGAVEPSLLFTPKRRSFNVKVGAEIPYDDTARTALKLGLWHRF